MGLILDIFIVLALFRWLDIWLNKHINKRGLNRDNINSRGSVRSSNSRSGYYQEKRQTRPNCSEDKPSESKFSLSRNTEHYHNSK